MLEETCLSLLQKLHDRNVFKDLCVCEGLFSVISNRKNFGVKYFDKISLLNGQTLCKCFSEML